MDSAIASLVVHEHVELDLLSLHVELGRCRRCGSPGKDPTRRGGSFDRPLTLCDGCLSAVVRASTLASRTDYVCPMCPLPPTADVELQGDDVRFHVRCSAHGSVSIEVWSARGDQKPILAWSAAGAGALLLRLQDRDWMRASFRAWQGDVLEFGRAFPVWST